MELTLSPFIHRHPCPEPGGGVHQWIFSAALSLRGAGLTDEDEITRIVTAYATRKDPREIAEAVRNSGRIDGTIGTFSGRHPRQRVRHFRPKADVDRKAVEALAKMYGGISLLQGLSPADPTAWTAQSLLDGLFPGNPLLCLAQNQHAPFTLPRKYFRGHEHLFPFLVPSPMSAPLGRNQQGRGSIRCLDNTGPRRFLVVEFDKGTIDEQASALIHLASIGPLVLVTHSGGRSLHGWFYCRGQSEAVLHAFHTYACMLGADPATWVRCQLVRMPAGVRETGAQQELLFLQPAACPGMPAIPATPDVPTCQQEGRIA